jgi:hypothetical protein
MRQQDSENWRINQIMRQYFTLMAHKIRYWRMELQSMPQLRLPSASRHCKRPLKVVLHGWLKTALGAARTLPHRLHDTTKSPRSHGLLLWRRVVNFAVPMPSLSRSPKHPMFGYFASQADNRRRFKAYLPGLSWCTRGDANLSTAMG